MKSLAPIETSYEGCQFRSRLEARWAVFLETNGIKWSYEPNAFALCSRNYLPDFWLPEHRVYVEIKAENTQMADFLMGDLAMATSNDCLLIIGDPFPFNYEAVLYRPLHDERIPLNVFRGGQLAKCRRCEGLCLVGDSSLVGGFEWLEFGTHECGDNERSPLVFDEEDFRLARSMRFHG